MNYNNQHTFDNYIVSECNKEAYTACCSIVDDADGRFVALYGPSPCGVNTAARAALARSFSRRLTEF